MSRRPQTLPRPTVADAAPPHTVTPRRRGRLVTAAVVLALTVGGWLAARPDAGAAPRHAAATDTAPAAVAAVRLPVTWHDFAGIDLPESPDAGPFCRSGNRVSCFAASDDGAALAAVHLLVRTFPFAGPAVFGPTIRDQVLGPDAAALARLTAEAYAPVAQAAGIRDGAPVPSTDGWVSGFRVDPPDGAGSARTVRVLVRQSDPDGVASFTEYTARLVRDRGDWRLVAPAWGDWRNAARPLTDADRDRYRSYDSLGTDR